MLFFPGKMKTFLVVSTILLLELVNNAEGGATITAIETETCKVDIFLFSY